MIRRRTSLAVVFLSMLALAGCANAEPTVDIEARAAEMKPVMFDVAALAHTAPVPEGYDFLVPGSCMKDADVDHERYSGSMIRSEMQNWGANGYTVETFTDATRELLVLPGWQLEEARGTLDKRDDDGSFWQTEFELAPSEGGASIAVTVHGRPGPAEEGGSLTVGIIAKTDCVPAE